jgi:hypothetical protein
LNRVDVEASFRASPGVIWSRLIDHEGMVDWLPVREVVRRRPGFPDPNGIGAVRTFRGGGLVIEERITDFKPEERIEYVLTAGAPVRDYRGAVVLKPDGEYTRIRWVVRFRTTVPGTGWILSALLRQLLGRALARLRPWVESAP